MSVRIISYVVNRAYFQVSGDRIAALVTQMVNTLVVYCRWQIPSEHALDTEIAHTSVVLMANTLLVLFS